MVTLFLLGAAIGAVAYLLASLVKIVKTCTAALNSVIEEFRLERQLLSLQKELLSAINSQITLQRTIIDRQLTMAMNTITTMRLMAERQQDPKWMEKFDEGRNNAKFN